jgi:hypothetical protein
LTSPRPYVAAAAASVLAALYFVPSASASPSHDAPAKAPTSRSTTTAGSPSAQLGGLADTGAVDTKPYLVGGAAFLVAGAGLVLNAGRRARRSEL